jgi:hypothetical protein
MVLDILKNIKMTDECPYNFNVECNYVTQTGRRCGIKGTLFTYGVCEKCILKKRCYSALNFTEDAARQAKEFITTNPRSKYVSASMPNAKTWLEEVEETPDPVLPGEEDLSTPVPETKAVPVKTSSKASIDQLYADALAAESIGGESTGKSLPKAVPSAEPLKVRKRTKVVPSAYEAAFREEEAAEDLNLDDIRADVAPETLGEEEQPLGEEEPDAERKQRSEDRKILILKYGIQFVAQGIESVSKGKLKGYAASLDNDLVAHCIEDAAPDVFETLGIDEPSPILMLAIALAGPAFVCYNENMKLAAAEPQVAPDMRNAPQYDPYTPTEPRPAPKAKSAAWD